MGLNSEWQRCEPHDPNRCQSSGKLGQCPYLAKPGSVYCPRHASMSDTLAAKSAANMYQLGQYQDRVGDFTGHNEIKNLRAEIGILRMTLEKVITSCRGDDNILLAYAGKISDMVIKIRVLVVSCQALEIKLGMMLDRDKIMLVGHEIVEIVGDEQYKVPQEYLDDIGQRIVAAIMAISIGESPPKSESSRPELQTLVPDDF